MPNSLLREHTIAEYRRSIRDVIWYGGNTIVMTISFVEKRLGIFAVMAAIAVAICGITAYDAVKWRRRLKQDSALDLPRDIELDSAAGDAHSRERAAALPY
jgi:hypothetical protein